MKCKLTQTAVPEGPPYYANGAVKIVNNCETHSWIFDGPALQMCPIGRIEEATDQAIKHIQTGHRACSDH
jgi:hypothetical protein